MPAVSFRCGRVTQRDQSQNRGTIMKIGPTTSALYARPFFEVLSVRSEGGLSAVYLKCDTEMDVSVPPYLLSSLILEGEILRRLAR
jgi:hypothetical protein